MPIYPGGWESARNLDEEFRLSRNNILNESFQRILQEQGLWWDNYLIVDNALIATLIDLTGGIDIGNGRSNGQQVVGLLPIAEQDVLTSMQLQARLALEICQRFDLILQKASPERMVEVLIDNAEHHAASSDLNSTDLQTAWLKMQAAGGLACEFPTLIGR
jgi:hypothetical protein